jgi:hypothetical protein
MNGLKQTLKFLPLLLLLGLSLMQSCREVAVPPPATTAEQFDSQVFLRWNELFTQIDRYAKGYRPGPAPRALAYLGLSAYESVVPGIPGNNSLANLYPGLELPVADPAQEYYWPACVNESYAYLMRRFFYHMETEYADLFDNIEQTRLQLHGTFAASADPEVLERSEKFGREVARAVYEWSATDAVGHNAFLEPQPLSYVPPTGPGLWAPTFPDFNRAVFPQWGRVRAFALRDDEKLARAPIPYSENENSLFYTQALEVYNTVKNINDNGPGGYTQRWIGEFWSDDLLNVTFSPPTRLIAIANQVVEKENPDLGTCAELYAKLGMALNDNGVAIWHSKYYYNVERPVSYIRRVLGQKIPEAANWRSLLNHPITGVRGITPAFPAYPSGHSGFGGAGAKILSSFFEYNERHPGTYAFTDRCHFFRSEFIGTPRTFASFRDLGAENAYSRIPLGVHFRMDCDEGLRLGELAAQRVLELPWKR